MVKRDYRLAPLDGKARALADFAAAVTKSPSSTTGEMIDTLRHHGWTDEQIHDATQVIALFNYFTRLADGLGVDPEPEMLQRKP